MDAIIGFLGPQNGDLLHQMAQLVQHRGSIRHELITSDDGTIARLTTDESATTGLPVDNRVSTSHDENTTILLAGFVTRVDPRVDSKGRSPLELLNQQYREVGVSAISLLQGQFLVLILDHENQSLHLARDGSGVRTAYFARHQNRWLVASEQKSIWKLSGFSKELNYSAIIQFLSYSFLPGVNTGLKGIFEVPGGHAVTLRHGLEPEYTNLFPFESEIQESGQNPQSWIKRTKNCVAEAVEDRMPSGEPVGVFLSGGLDSSIIAAEVVRQSTRTVNSYSIHFGEKYPNELEYARMVAKRIGTKHHEVLIQPTDFLPRFHDMVWHLDDLIGDPITQPNFELARKVSGEVRFIFNGEGGDPLFGGPKNLPMMIQHWYGVTRSENDREKAYLASYRRAYEECTSLLTKSALDRVDFRRDLESVLTPFFNDERQSSLLNKLMSINIRLKAAHLINPKVERMLASVGLTPLSPLFDEELVRLSFQMPPQMKLQKGIEKWVLKEAYRDCLPAEIVDRPKSGMRVPVHYWFQGRLKRWARRELSKRKLKRDGLWNPDRMSQLLRYDTSEGSRRFGLRLWMIMTFEAWRAMTQAKLD